ncbi:unnamed protein product [Adineta steineri]|uniref:RING-type domain-containing protein n=1 Tax=Adineta steineri TaxID=433720 RepID=A0A814GPS9_9BILA|nr:unnamed protein product [Adineta steineri]
MNKLEYIYVNEHLISPSLTCPICLDILEDPHTHILCDSAFCRSCLLKLPEPVCPICRWNWNDTLFIEYNRYLPKSSRLIRNMLDELQVQCVQCHTIRRRGQFEHDCQPIINPLPDNTNLWKNIQLVLSAFVIFLFILFIYSYRNFIFEPAIDRRKDLISGIGINIDKYLFEKIYYLIVTIIEYSIPVFIFNLFLWFSILFYGDRFTTKTTKQVFKKILEISIIINLITYSIYY